MLKKWLLNAFATVLLLLTGCGSNARLKSLWRDYQARFIQDGRVVDTGNGYISHSEGQGYGLLLAVAVRDRNTFDQLWQWTRANLQVRQDRLFMWRRRSGVPIAEEDPNNATDGDLLIAWALLEASQTWHDETMAQAAWQILTDLKRLLLRDWRGHIVLLPGAVGFERQDYLVLNLSYWIFPALKRLAAYDSDPVWSKLIMSGLALLRQARFSTFQLPADWLEAGENLAPWRERPPRFGYDAVRIPLYLIWAGYAADELLSPYLNYWRAFSGFIPPWIDLANPCLGAYPAPAGVHAIATLARYQVGQTIWFRPPPLDQDYYSSTLTLLSQLAVLAKP